MINHCTEEVLPLTRNILLRARQMGSPAKIHLPFLCFWWWHLVCKFQNTKKKCMDPCLFFPWRYSFQYLLPPWFLPSILVYCGLRCKVSESSDEAMSACQVMSCNPQLTSHPSSDHITTFAPHNGILVHPDGRSDATKHIISPDSKPGWGPPAGFVGLTQWVG